MEDTTIITAVTPKYEKFLNLSINTWKRNQQLNKLPMTLFTHGFRRPKIRFKNLWDDINIVNWNMPKWDSDRELMLSSFVLGVFKHTSTPFTLKIDSDALVLTENPIINDKDYLFDIIAHRWGYTKPKQFIIDLEKWYYSKRGKVLFDYNKLVDNDKNIFRCKRIMSHICLQRREFVLDCCKYLDSFRLPIPSHDTFLWYMAEQNNFMWGRRNFKNYVINFSRYRNFLNKYKEIMNEN